MFNLSKNLTKIITIFVDIFLCLIASYISISIRQNSLSNINFEFYNLLFLYFIPVLIFLPIFFIRGNYNSIIRYSSLDDFTDLAFNILICAFIYLSILIYFKMPSIPRSIGILHPVIFYNLLIIFRYIIAFIYRNENIQSSKSKIKKNALIYGAGEAGVKLLTDLKSNKEYKIFGFIDDNRQKIGRNIHGYKIFGKHQIEQTILKKNIEIVILALPSISLKSRKKIIELLLNYPVKVISVPTYADIVSGKASIRNLRPLVIDELINRDITISKDYIEKYFNKKVLVTGAGGSIGSELCRQIIIAKPIKLILIDNSEYNLYSIEMELKEIARKHNINIDISSLLISIVQEEDINNIFEKFKPEYVLHAAAYKHVPMLEKNIFASIKNNLFGTINLVDASHNHGVKEFLFVSSDKAVRPTNIMGASKRLAEIYVQSFADMNNNSDLTYSIVRFGNVLNSSGSIVPLFLKQIEEGGPLTVTHEEVTRFFMTISEAVNLILDSTSAKNTCEVFLLDMGDPIKIYNLARRVIELSGFRVKDSVNPEGDIEINIIGLRPGEKLYEELLIDDQALKTKNKHIFKAKEKFIKMEEYSKILNKIEKSLQKRDSHQMMKEILDCLPEFNHNK